MPGPAYQGDWSREGFTVSQLRVPRSRQMSPRSRSRSVHSPQIRPRPRFASGQQRASPLRPVQLFADDSVDEQFEWDDTWDDPESSAYFNDSPMTSRVRDNSPSRNPPSWQYIPPPPPISTNGTAMGYGRLVFNITVATAALLLALKLILSVQTDLTVTFERAKGNVLAEIAACTASYEKNYCRDNKSPALAQACLEWEKCMNLDPDKVGHLSTTARAFGEIIESFVGKLDAKSMVFLVIVAVGFAYF